MGWRTAISLAVAIGAVFLLLEVVYPRLEYGSYRYSVRGIDVSGHQGIIDWDRLKAAGIEFAYIKASEGETFNDPRFSRNWYGAEQAGIPRGAYHFFTQCRSGKVQAENFIRVVPVDPDALPPVIDAERMGPCLQTPAVKDVAAEIQVLMAALQAQYKVRPIIYTTREFNDAYLAGKFPTERFWVRRLFLAPRFREKQWVFWQYHDSGRRAGVSGPVDLDVFRGTAAELQALRKP